MGEAWVFKEVIMDVKNIDVGLDMSMGAIVLSHIIHDKLDF
jgi:hypothetical protein